MRDAAVEAARGLAVVEGAHAGVALAAKGVHTHEHDDARVPVVAAGAHGRDAVDDNVAGVVGGRQHGAVRGRKAHADVALDAAEERGQQDALVGNAQLALVYGVLDVRAEEAQQLLLRLDAARAKEDARAVEQAVTRHAGRLAVDGQARQAQESACRLALLGRSGLALGLEFHSLESTSLVLWSFIPQLKPQIHTFWRACPWRERELEAYACEMGEVGFGS